MLSLFFKLFLLILVTSLALSLSSDYWQTPNAGFLFLCIQTLAGIGSFWIASRTTLKKENAMKAAHHVNLMLLQKLEMLKKNLDRKVESFLLLMLLNAQHQYKIISKRKLKQITTNSILLRSQNLLLLNALAEFNRKIEEIDHQNRALFEEKITDSQQAVEMTSQELSKLLKLVEKINLLLFNSLVEATRAEKPQNDLFSIRSEARALSAELTQAANRIRENHYQMQRLLKKQKKTNYKKAS